MIPASHIQDLTHRNKERVMSDLIAKERLAICSFIKLNDISVTASVDYTNTNTHKAGKYTGNQQSAIHCHLGC